MRCVIISIVALVKISKCQHDGGLVSEKLSEERAHAGDFSAINTPNPPNPPYARAQARSDFPPVKEEDIGEVSEDDYNGEEDFEL